MDFEIFPKQKINTQSVGCAASRDLFIDVASSQSRLEKRLTSHYPGHQDLGFMRWLTVRVPGHPGLDILFEKPGPSAMDEAAARQVRELLAKGASSFTVGLMSPEQVRGEELSTRVLFLRGHRWWPPTLETHFREAIKDKLNTHVLLMQSTHEIHTNDAWNK